MSASGLDSEQEQNARTILAVDKSIFPASQQRQAGIVGLATALQESGLRNLNYGDRDSLGLFQQRSSWGTAAQRTTPSYAAQAFYNRLKNVPGWDVMPVTVAAQTVQVSAYPNAYAKQVPLATQATDALLGTSATISPASNVQSTQTPSIGGISANLTSPLFWERVGLFALGSVLLAIAAIRIISQTSAGQSAINTGIRIVKDAAITAAL